MRNDSGDSNKLKYCSAANTYSPLLILPTLVDNRLIRGDGTTTIQISGITVSDADAISGASIDADTNTLTNIENADIKAAVGIVDTKLATISTAGKVSNSATTATSANTASAIVARDASGDFTAGIVTAALSGNASTATALASNPSDCAGDTYATTIAASGNLTCASITNASTTATASNTISTIVLRDGSGNFAAGTITANLTGNASGSSGSTTGNAATATALAADPGDCGANTYATTIAASGALTCASITNASTTAVSTATNSTIVLRDGSANFAAGTITAALTGNASTSTALAADPADCASDTYATTIAASGALTCGTVTNAGLAGSIAFNKHVALTASRALVSDGSGVVAVSSVPSANIAKFTAANITYAAGVPTVTNEYGGDWISSITDTGTGQASIVSQGFTTAPACTCTGKESAVSGSACMITSTSTTSIPVRIRDLAATLADEHFFIVCAEFF